jgi:hypothetical protein
MLGFVGNNLLPLLWEKTGGNKMIRKAKTDSEFRVCGYGPKIFSHGGLNVRLRIDLPGDLRFGIFWFHSMSIELGFDQLGEIIRAVGKYSGKRFCNTCGKYRPALLTQDLKNGFIACKACNPGLFEIQDSELSEEFLHFVILKDEFQEELE